MRPRIEDPEKREEERMRWIKIANRSAFVACLLSYAFGFLTLRSGSTLALYAKYVVWLLWTVCPPAWFFIEFHNFAPNVEQKDEFDRFKYAQELYGKVWVAIVAGLGILYAGENVLKSIAKH
jgi:hypothetical protein